MRRRVMFVWESGSTRKPGPLGSLKGVNVDRIRPDQGTHPSADDPRIGRNSNRQGWVGCTSFLLAPRKSTVDGSSSGLANVANLPI
jgi:hypothetical protein